LTGGRKSANYWTGEAPAGPRNRHGTKQTGHRMIDLRAEQQATLARPARKYSLAARLLFLGMDLLTGRLTTLAKTKLLEILASIPYREWETRQYARMTRGYGDQQLVRRADRIVSWAREAQDNEYWHLLVISEKMKQDNVKDPWYLAAPVRFLMVQAYVLVARVAAVLNIRRAFLFNAEFEDHAEHVYARFVEDHPEWEDQQVGSALVEEYGHMETWAEVFRRIGLDERDHMNASLIVAGSPEDAVAYEGMPAPGYLANLAGPG
jgi:ubiquinol oxidase